MKKGWKLKPLKNVGKIFNGNSINAKIKKEKYLNQAEGLPYIATKDVSYDSSINYENGVKIPFSDKEIFRIAPKNSILICLEGGSAGRKVGLINKNVCFGNKLFAIAPGNETLSKYIFYWFKSEKFKAQFKSRLTGLIGGVSKKKFETITIPIPEISEQEYIVKKLDTCMNQVDLAIKKIEKNIRNTEELFKSNLKDIFNEKENDWDYVKLDEAVRKESSKLSINKLKNDSGEYPLYGASGFVKGISFYDQKDDYISIIKDGAGVGRIRVNNGFSSVVGTLEYLIPKKNFDIHFIYYFMLSIDFNNYIKGSTIPHIYFKDYKIEKIPYMSLSVQQMIKDKLYNFEELKENQILVYQKKIKSLTELKKSILEKAFIGEL